MARTTRIILTDDIDGSAAVETVTFGLDGSDYEMDLNKSHAAALRTALKSYVGAARKVRGSRRRHSSASGSDRSKEDLGQIRDWARANGLEVNDRGRISATVRDAYSAAH